MTRFFRLLIALLWAGAATAEEMALEYYEQCIGPALEKQARAIYDGAPCQATQTCSAYDASHYEASVELSCMSTAVSICAVSDDSDGCVQSMAAWIDGRTVQITDAFPEDRIRRVLDNVNEFTSQRLLRRLEAQNTLEQVDCLDQNMTGPLERLGVTRQTSCALLHAFNRLEGAKTTAASVERAEAEMDTE